MTLIKIYTVLILSIFLIGCKNQEKKINESMNEKINYVDQNFNKINNEEWSEIKIEFEKLIKRFNREQENLSIEERQKINKLIGKFYAIETKRILYNTDRYINDLDNRIEGFVDEIEKNNIK
jgi:hypothetical protein